MTDEVKRTIGLGQATANRVPVSKGKSFLFPEITSDISKNQAQLRQKKDGLFPVNSIAVGSSALEDSLKVKSLGVTNQQIVVDPTPQTNPRRRNVLGKTMSGFLNQNNSNTLSSTFLLPYSSQPFQPLQGASHTRVNSLDSNRTAKNPLKTVDSVGGGVGRNKMLSMFKRTDKGFRMKGVEFIELDATIALSDPDASKLIPHANKNGAYLQLADQINAKDEVIGSLSASQIKNSRLPSLQVNSASGSTIYHPEHKLPKSESKQRYHIIALTQEEKMSALQPISKMRESIIQTQKGIGQIIKKYSGLLYMAGINLNTQTKTSQTTFLSDMASTVAEFCKTLLDFEASLPSSSSSISKKPNPIKPHRSSSPFDTNPKPQTTSPSSPTSPYTNNTPDQALLNSLTQELAKTQNIVANLLSQEAELKAARDENKKLREALATSDMQTQEKLRKLQQQHETEVGEIKNSFYIVHKLRETIHNLEKQLTSQEHAAVSKSSKIEALEGKVAQLEGVIGRMRERMSMVREDLGARTVQSLSLRQELSQMKQGIMGIMFNREQRAGRAAGDQSSVMDRKEVVRDYVRQYEEETKKNTVSWYLVKNDGYEGDGVWSLSKLGQRVFARGGGKYWGADPEEFAHSHRSARGEIFENLVLKSMKMARSDVAFAEFHLAGPTYASLVQYELMDLSMKEIEELFTQKFDILQVNETIRAIMDSYYIELLSHEKLDTCPWFGEFVYLWFERFEVDLLTKKIVTTTQDLKITKRKRAEFSVLVTSPIFQKLWDGFTFTEFLSGRYHKDEILYYLNCRYLILLGLQQDTRGNSFDIYTYVPENHVQLFLDQIRVQQRIDSKENFLVQKLFDSLPRHTKTTMHRPAPKSAKKERNLLQLAQMNVEILNESLDKKAYSEDEAFRFTSKEVVTNYVDLYQVLRMMLEEYRACKISKYLALFELVKEGIARATRNERLLDFSSLQTIFQKMYPGITSLQIMAAFRFAISLGRGKISIESLYCSGENSGIYALTERFSVLTKYEFMNRVDCIRKGYISKNELKYNREDEALKLLAQEYGKSQNYPRTDLDFLHSHMQKLMENHTSEKVSEQRNRVERWAGSLGSINLVEQYEQNILALGEAHPRSVTHAGSLELYLGRFKRIETQIIEFREAMTANLHGGFIREFKHVLELIGENSNYSRVLELEKRKSKQIQAKNSDGRMIKAAFVRKLAEWYKMYVNLLSFKTAPKAALEISNISKKSQRSTKKKTTTTSHKDTNLLDVVSSLQKPRKSQVSLASVD